METCRRESAKARPAPPASSEPDAVLHGRLVSGRTDAGAEIYRRHHDMVERSCLRVLRDRDLAADVSHEVFFELLERPDRFDPTKGSLAGYLRMAARRRAIDVVRSRESTRAREDRFLGHPAAAPAADVAVEEAATRSAVQAAVARLPTPQQQVIDVTYYRTRTRQQAAVELLVPEGTVKSRLRLALARLGNDVSLAASI